jgi:hypothetical protein
MKTFNLFQNKGVKPLLGLLLCFPVVLILSLMATAQEEIEGISEMRNKWFERQRVYPYDTLQSTALRNALDHQWSKRQSQGFQLSASSPWVSIGPTPYYQSGAYYTGRIPCVKYRPNNPDTIYIVGHQGGFWRSVNGQAPASQVVFEPKTDGLQTQSSGAIGIAPSNNNIIYYGGGAGMYFFMYNYYGIGVYKSTDGGETWTGPYSSGLPTRIYIFRIAVHPNNPNIVYIAEHTGLYRSTNGGNSWVKVIPADGTLRQCNDVIISSDGQKIWAVGPSENWTWGGVGDEYKGIEYHISTNGGNSFTHIINSGFTHDTRIQGLIWPSVEPMRIMFTL